MGAPVRFQKAVPGSKENAAVKRRKACRSALWTGRSLPPKGQAQPQGGHRVRRSAPAPVGASPPSVWGTSPDGGRAPTTPDDDACLSVATDLALHMGLPALSQLCVIFRHAPMHSW